MEDKIKKINEMVDELRKAVVELFPNMTRASVTLEKDGRDSFNVVEWEDNDAVPTEECHRRELWRQNKDDDVWKKDSSSEMNDYYKLHGCLLEGESA